MTGHVFIVHSDLTKISCDAILIPGGTLPGPGKIWKKEVASQEPPGTPTRWTKELRVINWEPKISGGPRPWVVRTHNHADADTSEFIEPVMEFLRVAKNSINAPFRNKRGIPLFALPLIGTGHGGGGYRAGEIVQDLLPELYQFTKENQIDVALVMKNEEQYTAAQAVRNREFGDRAWPALDDQIRGEADRLADLANRRELVLFLGAGVSRAAGLPMWDDLLNQLGGPELASDPNFKKLTPLDRAYVIQQRLEGTSDFRDKIAASLRADHYSLAHALLAALPTKEIVTTNYDDLFEKASIAIEREVDVVPYDPVDGTKRWLLKMHGCITRSEDIVLTRNDYLRYDVNRGALAGLVQGLLITKHMLFVGFSMNDDNFHKIAEEVRRVVKRDHFGTSLSVAGNPRLREIWERPLKWVELEPTAHSPRLLEIFLDRMAAKTVATAKHLFDKRYDAMLTEPDKRLRDELKRLAKFLSGFSHDEQRGTAWGEVRRMLRRLGAKID